MRPPSHYALGFLPQLANALTPVAHLVNRVARVPGVGALGKRVAGIDPRRSIPTFATTTFRSWWRSRAEAGAGASDRLGEVI
ncbi:hypothetical protein KCW65_26080, partial [Mycobacterium tuberculosis]|nr:hypothetical protein [Mycobacterium tuberculosis]